MRNLTAHAPHGGAVDISLACYGYSPLRSPEEVRHQISLVAQELDSGSIPGFRISIAALLPDGGMRKVFDTDLVSYRHEDFTSGFRWKSEVKGIAGYCAAKQEVIFRSDLWDESDNLRKYWFDKGGHSKRFGGIICQPLWLERRQNVVAVLSLTSSARHYLENWHVSVVENCSSQLVSPVEDFLKFIGVLPSDSLRNESVVWYIMPPQAMETPHENESRVLSSLPDVVAGEQILQDLSKAGLSSHQQVNLLLELVYNIPIDPEHVRYAFETIIAEQSSGYGGKPRRKPVRVERIYSVFQRRENEEISSKEFEHKFEGTRNVYSSVSSAISWLNARLPEFNLFIETVRVNPTFYRLRWKYPS